MNYAMNTGYRTHHRIGKILHCVFQSSCIPLALRIAYANDLSRGYSEGGVEPCSFSLPFAFFDNLSLQPEMIQPASSYRRSIICRSPIYHYHLKLFSRVLD